MQPMYRMYVEKLKQHNRRKLIELGLLTQIEDTHFSSRNCPNSPCNLEKKVGNQK